MFSSQKKLYQNNRNVHKYYNKSHEVTSSSTSSSNKCIPHPRNRDDEEPKTWGPFIQNSFQSSPFHNLLSERGPLIIIFQSTLVGRFFFGVKVGGKDIMRWERWQGTMSIIKHKFQQNSSLWFSVVVLVRFFLFMLLLPRTRAFWHLFPLNLCHIIHTLTVHRFIISSAILRTQQFIQFLP